MEMTSYDAPGMTNPEPEDSNNARAARLRRAAARQGLQWDKSRRRDPNAYDYNTYRIVDAETSFVVLTGGSGQDYGLDLDDVEEYLDQHNERTDN